MSDAADDKDEAAPAVVFDLEAETTIFVTRGMCSDLRPQGIVLHHPDGLVVKRRPDRAEQQRAGWTGRSGTWHESAHTRDDPTCARAEKADTRDGRTDAPDETADAGNEGTGTRDGQANSREAAEIVLWSDRSPHRVEVLAPAGTLTVYNVWREARETFGMTGEAGIRAADLAEGTVMIECSDGHPPAESVDLRVELVFWQSGAPPAGDVARDAHGRLGDDIDIAPSGARRHEAPDLSAEAFDADFALADEQGQPVAEPVRPEPDPDIAESGLAQPEAGLTADDAPQRSSDGAPDPRSAEAPRLRSPRPGWLRVPRRPGGR